MRRFGDKYVKKFKAKVEERNNDYLRTKHVDILIAYDNLITWRNQFAHGGQVSQQATFEEVVQSYELGKEVLECLARAMQR